MRIAVCIKQVPDSLEVETDPVTHTLRRLGGGRMLNPYDLFAVEAALNLAEQWNASSLGRCEEEVQTVALSMGPAQAEEVLREAVSLGIDSGILLCDNQFAGGDTWATARVLAAALNKLQPDLVLCGKQASDGDTAQVGPEIAGQLGWAQGCYVHAVHELSEDTVIVERRTDCGDERVALKLPAVLTVVKEISRPRLATLQGKLAARRADIAVWEADDLELTTGQAGLKGSPTRVRKIFSSSVHKATVYLPADDVNASCNKIQDIIASSLKNN